MTRTMNDATRASDPGGVRVSHRKCKLLAPSLYSLRVRLLELFNPKHNLVHFKIHVDEHLQHGDSRAAVVVAVEPLLIAAYTDELDCITLLAFPPSFVEAYQLHVGSRLLTINTYGNAQQVQSDLTPGPQARKHWQRFMPFIAEFLSDDLDRIEERKARISEDEWTRAKRMGEDYLLTHGPIARHGSPLTCNRPAQLPPR